MFKRKGILNFAIRTVKVCCTNCRPVHYSHTIIVIKFRKPMGHIARLRSSSFPSLSRTIRAFLAYKRFIEQILLTLHPSNLCLVSSVLEKIFKSGYRFLNFFFTILQLFALYKDVVHLLIKFRFPSS